MQTFRSAARSARRSGLRLPGFESDIDHTAGAGSSQRSSQSPAEVGSGGFERRRDVLDKHYDQRSEERKSRRRREALENSLEEYV